MRFSYLVPVALFAGANAANSTSATSSFATSSAASSGTSSATSSGSSNGTTTTTTVHLPLVTDMDLKASVVNAEGSDITYAIDCATKGECGLPHLTLTERDHKTYEGAISSLGVEISVSCASTTSSAMYCSNSIGGKLISELGGLQSALGALGGSASASTTGTDLADLPSTTVYSSNEIGDVVVPITGGVEKLKAASTATSTGTSGSATSTSSDAGVPKMTAGANVLAAGGALAAFALAF